MIAARELLFAVAFAHGSLLCAQDRDALARAGWHDLPDSLYLVWKLGDDEVSRIRAIEADYDAERAKLMSDQLVRQRDRDARLRTMANARRKELRGVLSKEEYEHWMQLAKIPH